MEARLLLLLALLTVMAAHGRSLELKAYRLLDGDEDPLADDRARHSGLRRPAAAGLGRPNGKKDALQPPRPVATKRRLLSAPPELHAVLGQMLASESVLHVEPQFSQLPAAKV